MRFLLALHCFDPDIDRWRVLLASPERTAVEAFCHETSKGLIRELEEARSSSSSIVPVLEADLKRLNSVLKMVAP